MIGRILRLFRGEHKGRDDQSAALDALNDVLKHENKVIWIDSYGKEKSILNIGDYRALYGRDQRVLEQDPLDWMQAIHKDDVPSVREALKGQPFGDFDVLYRVVKEDGSTRWIHDRSLVVRDDRNEPLYLAGLAEDVTDKVALDEQLAADMKLRTIGTIAGGVAHDFNNILAVVIGNLELALSKQPDPEIAKHLNIALGAAERGATTTHRLLAYARQQPLAPEAVSVSDLIDSLKPIVAQFVSDHAEISYHIVPNVSECFADRGELETVLINLIINARDAVEGYGRIFLEANTVELDQAYVDLNFEVEAGSYVRFSISDNGIGMSKEVLERVFEPFFTNKSKSGGSGLGLSMAYGFAKQSRGNLKIYSEPGKGTTVNLYLPVAEKAGASSQSEPERVADAGLPGAKCIVVDDDPDVGEVIVSFLEKLGCTAILFTDPHDLIARFEICRDVSLLVTDVVLQSDIHGPELGALMQKQFPDIRIIYLSGYTENAIIHHGRLDEGIRHLQKPFSFHEFAAACEAALSL
jgi:signal transduction histidine kinase